MCLIVFAWKTGSATPLLAVTNRDEFYDRPAAPAAWWDDHPHIFAGRDLREGGTWLGVTREGRFAALTNIRAPDQKQPGRPTRGALVSDFLNSTMSAEDYAAQLALRAGQYNGFNLLLCDGKELVWTTNGPTDDARNGKPLAAGVYGLSNGTLDTPWPKLVRAKAQFHSLLYLGAPEEAYFDLLSDTTPAVDCRLPKTGVPLEWERLLSSICIASPDYGTRVSTVVQLREGQAPSLNERLVRA